MRGKNKFNIYSNGFRKSLNISILLIGAAIISSFIAIIQTGSSREKQKTNGINALNEISLTLQNNNDMIRSITFEYNKLNQNTTESLCEFENRVAQVNLFKSIVDESDVTIKDNLTKEACETLNKLQEDLDTGTIGVVGTDGNIVICSNYQYANKNLSEFNIENERFGDLFKYDAQKGINGTETITGDEITFSPVAVVSGGEDFFMYSSRYYNYKNKDYYLLLNISNKLLETELAGIDQIGNVLSSLSLGKDGFFFAIDTETGKFAHFNHKGKNLTGLDYQENGYNEIAAVDGYSGYQTINGTKYYCVTKSSETVTYGKYLIVCAAIDQGALIQKNLITVFVSCFAFVIVACIVYGQGMILDREIANHQILVENRLGEKIKDKKINGVGNFTKEEINERVDILMEDIIEKKKDNELRHVNIGFRNSRGVQRYFLPYVFNNMLPLVIIGLVSIFGIVYFSQTIMSVQDATSTSYSKLNEIGTLIEENNHNAANISEFVSTQYLSKNKLLSYILSTQEPTTELNGVFDNVKNDRDTFQLYKEENGVKEYLVDDFGNPRLSTRNSKTLMEMCKNNDLSSIYVFDYDGNTMITSENDWTFSLSRNEEDQSYEFRKILDGKSEYFIQSYRIDDKGCYNQYIGCSFFYYTYNDTVHHMTRHVNEDIYKASKDHSSAAYATYGEVHEHKGVVQISINQETLSNIYRIASLDYLLRDTSIYGSDSYFIAFDDTEEHKVIFAPKDQVNLMGRTAEDLGVPHNAFSYSDIYHGFMKINGKDCYESFKFVDGYFLASVISMSEINYNKLNICLMTFILSALFIIIGTAFFTISNNRTDSLYREKIKSEGKALSKPVGFVVTGINGKKTKTVGAYSRYFKIGWNRKTPEQKLSSILMVYLTIASFIILGIIIFALTQGTTDSIFTYIFSNKWSKGLNLFSITQAIMIIFIIMTASKILKFLVKWFSTSLGARAETTGNLIISVLKYGGVLGTIFYALYLFGFDTGGILTSAGILSVVIGLGAQSLIGDILAGMFIVFESEFRVGDIVTIGDFRGQVIEIGLRTTKLVDISNNVKVFNNSTISSVLNMTKESSFAVVDVAIEYGADLEKVERVLLEGFPKIRQELPAIIEGPFYRGIDSLGDSAVVLKIVANCEEKDRIQLARDLNREIFLLFKQNNINIPFNQITLSYLEEGGKDHEKNSNND